MSADDFYTGYLTTALDPDELMTEIRLPAQPSDTGVAFLEVSRRHGDFALAAVAACVALTPEGRCSLARLVVAGVDGVPYQHLGAEKALIGTKLSKDDLEEASRLMVANLKPQADLHASSDYRKQAARVLAARALEKAASRARSSSRARS